MTKLGIFYQNVITFLIKNILEKTARNKAFTTWVRFLFCSARAVVVQPVWNWNQPQSSFANRKTVKQSPYSTVLEVQDRKSTIQSALVFLSKYVHQNQKKNRKKKKKKNHPSHSVTHKHITVFKTISVSVTAVARVIKKETDTVGSDWHTGCYNQPTLSVTDGK